MTERIYLIDAMGLAFRSFFAIRANLTDAEGRPTNAVYGFARILMKILREHSPEYVAVVFDAPGKTFRNDLYEAYKATRPDTPPELLEQFPRMHELAEALSLPVLSVPGVEADDTIGTLTRKAEQAGLAPVIVTGDKDMLQLVNDTVRVFDPGKGDSGFWYGPEEVRERYGVPPEHVIDALALIGDASDNVPGVRGIGEKTAQKLLGAYSNLEGLYEHLDDLKGKQKEKIAEDRDQAFRSRELVTIRTDVDLPIAIEACRRTEPDQETALPVLAALQFHSLVDELFPGAQETAADTRDYRLVLSEEELQQAAEAMRTAGEFAVDTETDSQDPMRANLVGISLSAQEGLAYYIPVAHQPEALTVFRDPDDLSTAESVAPLPAGRVYEVLGPLLADAGIGKIGHNIKFDLVVFARHGLPLRGIAMDTMVASYLTDPSRVRHNLREVSLQYLRRKLTPITELIGRGSKAITFDHVPVDRACTYACEDADVALRLAHLFRDALEARELEALHEEVELPLIYVLARMEQAGIALDRQVFLELQDEIEARLRGLEAVIYELAGEPFTINSPKQLQGILFEKLGLEPKRKTKTGYSTDMEVLEQLANEHDLPGKILEYRGLEKLRSTYVEALPKLVHPETGRIHTSYNQAVAATGRLSSSEPNLQNIPVRTGIGRRIREGFVPGEKNGRLISADYSQIELRILAHLSGDQALRDAFERDADIHRDTAARVFNVAPEVVTSDMRRQAKAVNFGVVYGISPYGLARNLGTSNAEAGRFIDAYFAQYPDVRRWLDGTLEQARDQGYVTTLMQRRRYVPELKSGDQTTRRAAERAAINMPVQGSAADVIKLAMVQLDAALANGPAQMLLQVHDELVVEAPAAAAEEVAGTMRRIMENAVQLEVKLKVDVGIGNNWAQAH
ncbi:MAG: DNA polymerase I [Candidatus Hydrogenedentota bacterium]